MGLVAWKRGQWTTLDLLVGREALWFDEDDEGVWIPTDIALWRELLEL